MSSQPAVVRPVRRKLLDRDLSWLAFNHRVLQEAQCPHVPLLERLRFIAIFSSNLDEYFKVRIAGLRRARLDDDPAELLPIILEEVERQQQEFGDTFKHAIVPALRREHIHLLSDTELDPSQVLWVRGYFHTRVRDLLSPIALDDDLAHLFLRDQAVYLTILLSEPGHRVLVMELPDKRHGGRFVQLPQVGDERCVMFLEDVIRCGIAVDGW